MKQDLRRTDTEISSKFYNNPLISEGVSKRRFYFLKIYSLCNSDRANDDNIDLLAEREREREREREKQDTMVGKGMDVSE